MRSQQRWAGPAPTLSVPPVPAVHGDLTGIVTRLHNTFFAGFPGRVFVSLFGFALGALVVGGVVLHPRQEGTLWRLRLGAVLRTAAYDAHRLFGLWLAPLLLLITVTGVFSGLGALATVQLAPLAFPDKPGQVMQALMQPYARPASGHRAPMASMDELMLRHRQMNPDFRVQGISVHHWGDAHAYATLRGTQRWQLNTAIFERYHYALTDLGLLRHDSAANQGPFTQGFIAIQPLHFARYADAASRWLHALAGLAGAVLAGSGTWLWLRRHASDSFAQYLRPWLSGMTLGLLLACSTMFAITALTPDSWPSRQRWQAMGFGLTWAGALICCLLPGKWRARLPTTLLRRFSLWRSQPALQPNGVAPGKRRGQPCRSMSCFCRAPSRSGAPPANWKHHHENRSHPDAETFFPDSHTGSAPTRFRLAVGPLQRTWPREVRLDHRHPRLQ